MYLLSSVSLNYTFSSVCSFCMCLLRLAVFCELRHESHRSSPVGKYTPRFLAVIDCSHLHCAYSFLLLDLPVRCMDSCFDPYELFNFVLAVLVYHLIHVFICSCHSRYASLRFYSLVRNLAFCSFCYGRGVLPITPPQVSFFLNHILLLVRHIRSLSIVPLFPIPF